MSAKSDPIAKARVVLTSDAGDLVLLSRKRAEGRSNHGKLEMLGGHIELGETPYGGLIRELREEENTGALADIVERLAPGHRTMIVDEAPHHLFEIRIPADDCLELVHDPVESLGFERVPAAELGISNLNIGGSGTFLSGFYSKRLDLVALAVMEGREMAAGNGDSPDLSAEQLEGLLKLARIYWRSRTGNIFQRLVANIQLAAISMVAGDVVDPLYEAVAENLPVERRNLKDALRDWDYATDYLHQKLLLVDRRYVQLGGRNIEDAYHLLDAQLESGIRFMDTDVRMAVTSGGAAIEQSFERIWNLRQMVATLPEIRQHAPNDLAANMDAFARANEKCAAGSADDNCFDREFSALAQDLEQRESTRYRTMQTRAGHFQSVLRQQLRDHTPEGLDVDRGAQIYYIENIPFSGKYGETLEGRSFGADNDREARSGKR